MKQYYDAFKARVKKQGRDPDECKVFFLTKPIIGDTDEAAQQRADELYANAPVEAGLASLSTHAADRPVDLRPRSAAARRDPDAGHPGHPQPARSLLHVRANADAAGHRHPQGQHRLASRYIGTPERVADELARTIDAVGGDGFAIRQGIWPGYVGPFVEKVIPLLQQRGVVRTEYTGTTLREHLREF